MSRVVRASHWIAVILAALSVGPAPVMACEIRVRDSAFRTVRDVHRLCVIADSRDQSAIETTSRLEDWLEARGGELNLAIQRVNAEDPDTNWRRLGIPSQPPRLPVTVLLGTNNGTGESFVIDHWEPAPDANQLRLIAGSPVREQLASELAKNVAVLLFAPRKVDSDSPIADQLHSLVDAGIADERIGMSMITIDRNDPEEQLLCRFMGIRQGSADTLCVAFGRGKLMSPPLIGDEISWENIEKLVNEIRQACSCSKPLPTMGVDLPLVWTDQIDATVVLMDEELDLQNLGAEVEQMLATKAEADTDGKAKMLEVPLGRSTESADSPKTESDRSYTLMIINAIILLGVVGFAILRRRRPHL